MPFKSKVQLGWMAAAEDRGEVPKGTFNRWKKHTKNISALPEKVKTAYDLGVFCALESVGLIKQSAQEEPESKPEGKETRLKLDHRPYDFYNVKRNFERAAKQKIEVGTHVALKKEDKP